MISEQRRPRFEERGQLTPRERLARLLDPGMPFMAIGNIAGYLLDTPDPEKSIPGSTIIAGIGFISGVRCVVVVDDSGIQAGSLTQAGGYRLTPRRGHRPAAETALRAPGRERRRRPAQLHGGGLLPTAARCSATWPG